MKTIGCLKIIWLLRCSSSSSSSHSSTRCAAAAAAILIKHTSFYFFAAVFSYNHVKCFCFFHLRWTNQHTRRGDEAGQPRTLEEEGLSFNFIVQFKQLFKRFVIYNETTHKHHLLFFFISTEQK
jgi:hypothetical protein